MKKTLFLFYFLGLTGLGFSQITLGSGAQMNISYGKTVTAVDIINNGGSIDLAGNATIEILGDLENNLSGLITTSSMGTVKFNGSVAQEITGDHDAGFYGTVEIDNSEGVSLTNTVTGANQTINGTLAFTDGLLKINTFNLTLGSIDALGAGDGQYVQTNSTGVVTRTVGATDILFPIGNIAYNPLIINNTGISDDYSVKVYDSKPGGFTGTTHIVDRTWEVIEATTGGSDLSVTTQWKNNEEVSPFDETNCAVGVTNTNGANVFWGSTGLAIGGDPYTRTMTGVTTVGKFMVGDYYYSGKRLDLKLFLAGAYNGITMDKDLNDAGLIPTTDPYDLITTVACIPTDAVDWVKIELRDQTTPLIVSHSYAFFVDVNGDLIDVDGSMGGKITGFDNAVPYYVAVQHRNHLGIMSATPIYLNVASPTYNYSTYQTQAWQDDDVLTNAAMKNVSSVFCLWEGNAKSDAIIRYDGTDNDRLEILNSLPNAGATLSSYANTDVNMDGITRYDGTDNDRLVILNVLPNAGSTYSQHIP